MTLSFPQGTEMFHFPWFASPAYAFGRGYHAMTRDGLPHSGIPASMPADGSAGLIAVYYALHRLRAPRHPPYALSCLITPNKTLLSKNLVRGDGRDRTGDLLLAKQALSQLSYIPINLGLSGIEPETSPLSRARSNQLS